jgi:hypothetical protein
MAAERPRRFRSASWVHLASMRPRPNGRGKRAAEREVVLSAPRFNEAAAKWPRKASGVGKFLNS